MCQNKLKITDNFTLGFSFKYLLAMNRIPHFSLFLTLLICFFSIKASAQSKEDNSFVVVLDAGHGGHDSGNRGNGYYEKHIALKVTKQIGKMLQKEGIKVIYTRQDVRFIELDQRANIANKADANLFVSIHCDAFSNPKAYGAGTFVLGLHRTDDNFRIAQKENSVIFLEEDYETKYEGFDPNDPASVISLVLMQEAYLDQSIIAASTIQKSFVSNLKRKDRTVKQAGFLVLRKTYMPSVLVELGFLTNSREGAYLNSSKGQKEMSSALFKAIMNYKQALSSSLNKEASIAFNPLESKPAKKSKKQNKQALVFRIQIAAGAKKIALEPFNFKGLSSIHRQKEGGLYRYFYGAAEDFEAAKKLKEEAKAKGFSSAFIVAFKDGKKVKLSAAILGI